MSSQQTQGGKQFQVRRTQVLKASPTQNPSQQSNVLTQIEADLRKQGLQPLQMMFQQQEQAQKVEREQYVPILLNQEKKFPQFPPMKIETYQYLAQNKDNIFQMKQNEGQQQPSQISSLQEQNNALLQKCKKLEDRLRTVFKTMSEQEVIIRELKAERDDLNTKIQELQDKCVRQKLKKQILRNKVESLQNEMELMQENPIQQNNQDEADDDNNSHTSQQQMVLTHNDLYRLLEYLQARAQGGGDENMQNYQLQDIDTDNMTYEQLLALEEQIGNVSKGLTKEQIKQIPKHKVVELSEMPDRCTVCLTEFKVDDKFRELGCKHRYHSGCIKGWLQNQKFCPLCKIEVVEQQ